MGDELKSADGRVLGRPDHPGDTPPTESGSAQVEYYALKAAAEGRADDLLEAGSVPGLSSAQLQELAVERQTKIFQDHKRKLGKSDDEELTPQEQQDAMYEATGVLPATTQPGFLTEAARQEAEAKSSEDDDKSPEELTVERRLGGPQQPDPEQPEDEEDPNQPSQAGVAKGPDSSSKTSGPDSPAGDALTSEQKYQDKTVEDLRNEVRKRNESRPAENRLAVAGSKEELVQRLVEDDRVNKA